MWTIDPLVGCREYADHCKLWGFSMTVESVFDECVDLLNVWAAATGLTYKEINVWIFCVIWPAVTLLLLLFGYWQTRRVAHYKLCWLLAVGRKIGKNK